MAVAGEYRFFAGWRSDPFFFDTEGALNNFQFTGHDFFAGKNVCSMVLEVPNDALGSNVLGLWPSHSGRHRRDGGSADRGARPSQAVFLTAEQKGAYLAAQPVDDARFVAIFAHSLEHTGGYSSRKRSEWQKLCCRIFCSMILGGRRRNPTMAEHSQATLWTVYFPPHEWEADRG